MNDDLKPEENEINEEEIEDSSEEIETSKMPLTQHLEELRKRIFYALAAIIVLTIVAFIFITPIFSIIQQPFQAAIDLPIPIDQFDQIVDKYMHALEPNPCPDESPDPDCLTETELKALGELLERNLRLISGLIFTHPVEGFFTFLKLALFTALIVGMPFLLAQIWRFVVPALYPNEKGFFLYFLSLGSAMFYGGAVFCYVFVLPIAIDFLVGFGGEVLTPLFSIGNYISFSMLMMLVFGLSFEMPLAMFILVKMGLVPRQTFIDQWKYIVVGAFVIGALFTPPDPITQMLMGGSIVVLYGVGLILTLFAQPKDEEFAEEYEDDVDKIGRTED